MNQLQSSLRPAHAEVDETAEFVQKVLENIVKEVIKDELIDLAKEFGELPRDRMDPVLRGVGQAVMDMLKKGVADNKKLQEKVLAIGLLAQTSRKGAEILADRVPAKERPPSGVFVARIKRDGEGLVWMQVVNRTGRPLHHVMLSARSIADENLVRRSVGSHRTVPALPFLWDLANGDIPSPDAINLAREGGATAQLQQQIQLLDFGGIVYVKEWPASAVVTMLLCEDSRLHVSRDARVSIWSDEFVLKDLKPNNFAQVLADLRAPPKPAAKPISPFELHLQQTNGTQTPDAKPATAERPTWRPSGGNDWNKFPDRGTRGNDWNKFPDRGTRGIDWRKSPAGGTGSDVWRSFPDRK